MFMSLSKTESVTLHLSGQKHFPTILKSLLLAINEHITYYYYLNIEIVYYYY